MDFNIGSQYLCSNWAKSITIDYSTWRYIKPIRILKDLHRILKSDGSIYFEHGISSFTISNRNGFDFDNPSHLILTRQRLIEWIGDTQILAKFFAKYRGQTVIVPAYSERTETIEKQIGQSLKIATMDYLYESYCKEFSEYFQVSRTMLDLETSKPVFQWIQLTPIAIDS
jgi:hypothetical protein